MATQSKTPTPKKRIKLFASDLKTENLQKMFDSIYSVKEGNWKAIKTELTEEKGFTPELVKDLEFTETLAKWSNDNSDVINLFKNDKAVHSMRDVAINLNKASFVEKVKTVANGETEEEKDKFVRTLHRKLFDFEPTAIVVNMVKDPKVPILNDSVGSSVARVLEKNSAFNIRRNSVYEILKDETSLEEVPLEVREHVTTQLKTIQRIAAIAPVAEALPVLYQAKLHTAYQVAEMPRKEFVTMMKKVDAMGDLDDATLEQIHHNAQKAKVRNEQVLVSLMESSRGTGIAMIDKSLAASNGTETSHHRMMMMESGTVNGSSDDDQYQILKEKLSWDLLFGDADFCECGECNSVYSAAAYYVELLQYLRNNNLDPSNPNTDQKGIAGTPVEKLFNRRPDLACLQLTCTNTNTILPYIDLVNEVMENYVAFKKLRPFNVEDETSSELLAEPQNTEYQAYCILKNAVYPFTLPYHQPIDATRIYLKYLETSRHEVIDTFRKSNDGDEETLADLKTKFIDRAVAAEYLGLTKEEFVILTKEGLKSKGLVDLVKGKVHTDAEYQELSGVKPIHEYYGYGDEATMLADSGLTLIKKEFLPRTGVDYFNLVDLLKTEFINPRLPKGKSKVIMESLRFSYRFLQHFALVHGIEEMAEKLADTEALLDMLPHLKNETLFSGEDKKELSCPTCVAEEERVSKKDIINWVKCHFQNVGKMIVIESGRGCFNGKIVTSATAILDGRFEMVVRDCKIYASFGENEAEIGSIDKKTGKLTLISSEGTTPESLKQLQFIGEDGEKGVFMFIGNDIYLIILEQKDSCDLSTALLQHLDGTAVTKEEYDKIHRFIRLWRKLGWTIDETDKAIVALSGNKVTAPAGDIIAEEDDEDECNDCHDCDDCDDCGESTHHAEYDINARLILELAAVKKVERKTSIEIIKLLSLWGQISTAGEKSLYKRLFLTHNLVAIDKVFRPDARGNYLTTNTKISEHMPVLMAAFNLTADNIEDIMAAVSMTDKLTIDNVSTLYRHRLLAKTLGLKIPDFLKALPLFNDVFKDASHTLVFLEQWEKIEDAGFNVKELNYVVRNVDDEKKPLGPSRKTIMQVAKTLYDGLNSIDADHPDLKAEETISDPLLQQANIEEQATANFIRSKAALLFDTAVVEKIIEFLEGTGIFSTNAPKNLNIEVAEDKTLSVKLKYDKVNGAIQITGILTEAETIDFKALSNDPLWSAALTRIEKQQRKAFRELFSGILEAENTKTESEKAALKEVLSAGDIQIAIEDLPEDGVDTNTAPKKRAAFLSIFLPYLRQKLAHRFVVDTVGAFAALENKTTDLLISSVLSTESSGFIYSIFESVKESAKPDESNWNGYFTVGNNAPYTFVVRNTDVKPGILINDSLLEFTVAEDPTNEWWSATVPLQPGVLYKLNTVGVELKNIFWKTPASTVAAIPASSLIPEFATSRCEPALILLKKVALVVNKFSLGVDEVQFLHANQSEFSALDFNALTFAHWLRLEAYTRLRNSLPENKLTLQGFFQYTYNEESDPSVLAEKISDVTNWKIVNIAKLISTPNFNLLELADFRNEENLLKLLHALGVAEKIGLDINLLFKWAIPTSKFNATREIAEGIKNAMRAKYKQDDWEQVVKPLHDELRNNQKSALIAYLLQQPELINWGVTDADGLFEYFLIDVQMEPCMETSRIKQAINSVQLFVQRCFLGLEEEHSSITPDSLDRARWEWMQRYRVWEANRKVFLYPENWIESSLRDDKTSFFRELESELLQKDINKENVTDALKSYLYKVDEVANMEVVGFCIDGSKAADGSWAERSRLHVFSRTRNAPYMHYYRYLALDEKNWYPWEKMQIDIPNFDVEDRVTQQITGNGCYLTPVVWNDRLMVFFPQILKKTKPATVQNSSGTEATINEQAEMTPSSLKAQEYFEIKMAWSEYRNRKWTQKQLSKEVVYSDPRDANNDLQYFKFVPVVYSDRVLINVDDNLDSDGGFKGAFEFNGSILKDATAVSTAATPINYFNQQDQKMFSWEMTSSSLTRRETDIYFAESLQKETVHGLPHNNFHHAFSQDLLGKVNSSELVELFKYNLSISDTQTAFGGFDPDSNAATDNNSYHELKRAYSLYNWETFFHAPLMLADALSKAQQFEEAMKWYHFVFNPMAEGADDKRFWQFKPFKEIDSQKILNSIFDSLQPNKADETINEWRDKPFRPHVVARSRPVAYMKWVVMKYVDNLIEWGDYLFRQDTIESINQATQLYILASHILGQRPLEIPKRGVVKPETYLSLLNRWDAFGNAVVELELVAPFSNQTALPFGMVKGQLAFANVFGLASTRYFCIPNNPKLNAYWDTVADRLYKIRHCLNIQGVFRKLPLFEPPIDPALLVKAAAQGLSIASVLNDLNSPLPNFRFYYLLQKALELCGEVKSMGNALLSVIEKKDTEALSALRSRHESAIQNLVMEIKKQQLEEAQRNLDTLEHSRKAPEHRMKYYLKLVGEDISKVPGLEGDFSELANAIESPLTEGGLKLLRFEKEDMDKAKEAADFQTAIGVTETIASILNIIPTLGVYATPIGVGGTGSWGGSNLGSAASAVARGMQTHASNLNFQSAQAGKKGNFLRALQERLFQANSAGYEIKQIDKQITAQKIRVAISSQEIVNQQKLMDNAVEVEEFLRDKYTNEELYGWMRGNLKTLYHQVYSLAYELATKAEKVYRFERGITNSNFIQPGYWDAGRDGLLAGDQLFVGLKQLEAAYQNERGYDYEIVKHVSLKQIDPLALIELRETGKCEFAFNEYLFDMDYPGHYKRRIKSLSMSIPCVVGPYTSVNATLRLLESKFRNSALNGKAYQENTEETDPRFSTFMIPINAIASSGAQNDAGLFELNFKDERYLPFEGAGVISKWRLQLPEMRQFDYNTIPDVVIHVRYTSCEGGEHFRKSASEFVKNLVKSNEELAKDQGLFTLIDLKHDLPGEWHKATTVKDENGNNVMDLAKLKNFLPYHIFAKKESVKATDVILATDVSQNGFQLDEETFSEGVKVGDLRTFVITEESLSIENWKLTLPEEAKDAKQMFLITRMVM